MSVVRPAVLLLLAWAGACASPSSDIDLAPLYQRTTAPDYQRVEMLGGLARYEEDAGRTLWALNPLLWRERRPDGRVQADYFMLLGRYEFMPERNRTWTRLVPFLWYRSERRPDGVQDTDWALLPFFLGGSSSDGKEDSFAFFPFYGHLRDWLTFEDARFFLFPLWAKTRKPGGTESTHWLWPFFGRSSGRGQGWHLWPFYGEFEVPGRQRRSYLLWPFWQESETDLHKPNPRRSWFLFPLYGKTEQGDFEAVTFLWPFFGRSSRPSTEYSSWQLWPLLKFESGGHDLQGQPLLRRLARFLPFYLHFEDQHTEFTSWVWPFFWRRHDEYGGQVTDGTYAVPLWWHLRTKRYQDVDGDGQPEEVGEEVLTQSWPLFAKQDYSDGRRHFETPYLGKVIARNLTNPLALWQSHQREAGSDATKVERAFLGLYHSVRSGGHHRWSVPVVGGVWTEPDGTRHHSWLFGLLRWRSGSGGGLERPAFPGPGWPDLHRMNRPLQPTDDLPLLNPAPAHQPELADLVEEPQDGGR